MKPLRLQFLYPACGCGIGHTHTKPPKQLMPEGQVSSFSQLR